MENRMKKTIFLAIVMVTFFNVNSQIKVDRLKCEYLTNPEGIDMGIAINTPMIVGEMYTK